MTSDKQPDLTAQEYQILRLLAQGSRTSEIAKRLRLDYRTVADSCRKVKQKLQIDTIAGLAAWLDQNRPPE